MLRKVLAATASAALVLGSVTPAFAQSYGYSAFDAPRGATASINFKVPLGVEKQAAKPTYGFSLNYGHEVGSPTLDGRTTTREMKLADIRFSGPLKLQKAEMMTFDLAHLDQDRRLNMSEDGDNTVWIIVGLVAAGVAICLLADCFGGDDDDDDDDL